MLIVAFVGSSVQNESLKKARAVGLIKLDPAAANAPLSSELQALASRVWDKIEGALKFAYSQGALAAQPYLEAAYQEFAAIGVEASKRADEVKQLLLEKLNAYLQNTIDESLAMVRPSLSIDGEVLKIRKISIDQKLNLSGSLKASLESLCEFIAEKEIVLSVEYGTE